jgi:hypothetical protein
VGVVGVVGVVSVAGVPGVARVVPNGTQPILLDRMSHVTLEVRPVAPPPGPGSA